MKGKFSLVILSLFAVLGCSEKTTREADKDFIVSVDNQVLTLQELKKHIPEGVSSQDSIIAAEHYIQFWIQDILMYDVASKNISNKEEIDQLVENYRRSLVTYQYQEQLVEEKLSKKISEEEIDRYYKENRDHFKLDVTLIKGQLIVVPKDAPHLKDVRSWYKSSKPKDLESLDKYIVQNAVTYDSFYDNWVDLNTIEEKLPVNDLKSSDLQSKYVELQDSTFCYFLHIQSYILPGSIGPEEYMEDFIKEILINQKKVDFLRAVETDVYNTALKRGRIIFHDK